MFTRLATRFVVVAVIAALPVALASCDTGATDGAPASSASTSLTHEPSGGMKIAPGLYDLDSGTVQAVGTVEYRDLEGGSWAVIGGSESAHDAGKVVAVIANGADFARQFEQHPGLSMIVTGTRLEGASTRMAGPEIAATRVVAASDAPPGPAE